MSNLKSPVIAPLSLLLAILVGLCLPLPQQRDYERVSGFSVERAMMHVRAIAREAHPIGSVANTEVRDYIVQRLQRLPVVSSEQRAVVATHMVGGATGAHVTNLLCRIRGKDSKLPAILLAAHYDSVPSGSGASDDAAAVAALLETARLLSAGPSLRRDLYLLFTDGEEFGLLGATAFVREHALAKDIGLVLNFEARGSRGPLLLFQTSNHDAELISELAKAVTYPNANSLFTTASRLLPNDTDITAFYPTIPRVLGFAFAEGLEHYHQPTDTPDQLDPKTLAQVGATTTELARHFAELEVLPRPSSDALYFDLWGRWLVHYSVNWAAGLGCCCVMLWVWLVRRSGLSIRSIRSALWLGIQIFGGALACGIAVSVSMTALSAACMSGSAWIVQAPWVGLAALLVSGGLVLLGALRLASRARHELMLAGTLGIAALGALLGGWFTPGMSALEQGSTAATLGVWAWVSRRGQNRGGVEEPVAENWMFAMPTALSGLFVAPVVAMALRIAGPTLIVVPVLIGVMQFVLLLPLLIPCAARWQRATGYIVVALGVSIFLGSLVIARTASAVESRATMSSDVVRTVRPPSDAGRTAVVRGDAEHSRSTASIETRRVEGEGPRRIVELRITAASSARCVRLRQVAGPSLEMLSVEGKPIKRFVRFTPQFDEWGFRLLTGDRSPSGYRFGYCAVGTEPLVLTFQVMGAGPVELEFTQEFDEASRAVEQDDVLELANPVRASATLRSLPRRLLL